MCRKLWCGLRTLDEPEPSEVSTDNKETFFFNYFLHNVTEQLHVEEEF